MDHVLTLALGEQDTDQRRIAKLWGKYNPRGKYFRTGHRPAFFKRLAFAQDSGFSDIPNLTDPQSTGGVSVYVRSLYAALLASFVIYNIAYLIHSDLTLLPEACRNHTHQGFLLSRFLTKKLLRLVGFETTSWDSTCQEKFAGYLELMGLIVLLSRAARNVAISAFPYSYIRYATTPAQFLTPKYAERIWQGLRLASRDRPGEATEQGGENVQAAGKSGRVAQAKAMEISKEAVSGNGTLENVGIKLDGQFKCPHCRQTFSDDKARQLHLKFQCSTAIAKQINPIGD
ncbi:unnamed protein product [Prorocentrum cordatum]|uniref:C2H2-type domain-containing protein n=1 Tax=Prorocentrum cordatum TaxID=2364126 RepID=A0ABN9TA08_9DINO|nr:unnamed protein product [Polarella glacialis]